ncbi:MAG: PASTA domain-containing protein, partial [Acidimicrobiales bacterium]
RAGRRAASAASAASAAVAEPARRRRWPRVVGALLAVAAILAGSFFGYRTLRTPSHKVPRLIDLSRADAESAAKANHWSVTVNEVRQDGTSAGTVINQQPAEGASLEEKKNVTLTLSLGQTLVAVPADLATMTIADATAALEQAGLAVGAVAEEFDEQVPVGVVINVADGTPPQVEKGLGVDLVVSQGPEPRTVPTIAAGTPYEQAAKQIQDLGLTVTKSEAFDDAIAAGGVLSIDPPAGQKIDRGAAVTIAVSKGKPIVPDVNGKSVADANDILKAAGFEVTGVQGSPFRTVTGTTPAAGTAAAKGTGVTLITR